MASVPPEHQITSSGAAPRSSATCQRQRSNASAAASPWPCRLEGLPQLSRQARSMASHASGARGVVAQASR